MGGVSGRGLTIDLWELFGPGVYLVAFVAAVVAGGWLLSVLYDQFVA